MRYRVRFTAGAERDLLELYDFLAERDVDAAEQALGAVRKAVELLGIFPFACRKALASKPDPFLREMVVSFGDSGYVMLYRIESRVVTLLAVRHQRQEDFL
ncbi:MAG: type II toxin-antitoxin system RelE/ParE family toxin [Deltaproteobacteria bacterium]|nr:type II toxin-antitoxin system RelE/ParE family toxin [Deltaproteobacteria bacterium]